MKRATVGSLLFVGATVFFLAAPGVASTTPAASDSAPAPAADEGPKPAPPAVTEPDPETTKVIPANVGLKGLVSPDPIQTGSCPEGMVEVEGDYCPNVEQKCLKWMDPEGANPRRCTEFAPTGACQGKTTHKKFCIDRFEWPNKVGENPVIMKTWYEAADACKGAGKRLCGDSEWTLACEGQERLPYPYGHERNSQACNIDKSHPDVNEAAIANPATRAAEIQRLWQGEPSGSRESCVSPFGAFDMTGNVDEWVVNEGGMPYKSGLKGGYWGPVRDRCRPMTTAHNEQFSFYQIGFRCCQDAPSNGKPTSAPVAGGTATPTSAKAGSAPVLTGS